MQEVGQGLGGASNKSGQQEWDTLLHNRGSANENFAAWTLVKYSTSMSANPTTAYQFMWWDKDAQVGTHTNQPARFHECSLEHADG